MNRLILKKQTEIELVTAISMDSLQVKSADMAAVFKNSLKTDTGGANSLTRFKRLCKKSGMLCLRMLSIY